MLVDSEADPVELPVDDDEVDDADDFEDDELEDFEVEPVVELDDEVESDDEESLDSLADPLDADLPVESVSSDDGEPALPVVSDLVSSRVCDPVAVVLYL